MSIGAEERVELERIAAGNGHTASGTEKVSTTPLTRNSFLVERNQSLPFRPLAEALANTPAEPDWLLNGFIAPGAVTLWAGRPKVGKSTLLFGALAALQAGSPFIGRATQRAGALLLSEERADTLADKHRTFCLDESVDVLMRHEARAVDWPTIVDESVGHCLDNGRLVLVVDTWDKWAGLSGDQENSSGSVNEAMFPLMDAASKGLAVLIVSHQRKSAGQHGDAVRGSNALTGAVDIIVEVERVPGDVDANARVLRSQSRYTATPEELTVRLGDGSYEACGTVENVKAEIHKAKLLAVLDEAGELTPKDAAELVDESTSTARRYLEQLFAAGRVERTGEGKRGNPYVYSPFLSTSANPLVVERNEAPLATPQEEALAESLLGAFDD